MKEGYTHITVILDRTGSMESIRDDTIGGFNAFLGQQKGEVGTATLSLIQFDSQDPYEVIHSFKPIAEVPGLTRETYVPRARTPLLDAIGRGINDLAQRISAIPEPERPAKVMFVIVTDGQENASREFRKHQIEAMIRERTEKDGWQFVFLSADWAAIQDAQAYGFTRDRVRFFDKTSAGSAGAWHSLSRSTSDYRSGRKKKFDFDPGTPPAGPAPGGTP